ncbi:MAG: 5'-methylthioadenosine/S-adenosylhomocysteine nucleosidase [Hyphomonadaceae bacterium]
MMARQLAYLPVKRVSGKSIAYVMALSAEYGEHLKRRLTPLMTGVGPVEAGIVFAEAMTNACKNSAMPDLVVSLGSAGSQVLEQTAVYQAKSVRWRDMDASALGFEKGETPFLDLPPVLDLPLEIPDVPAVRLSTGANVVSGAGYQGLDADMVDMETFALKRVCQRFDVPLIALRGISDGAADLHYLEDWTQYLHIVDEKLAAVIDKLEAWVASGEAGI